MSNKKPSSNNSQLRSLAQFSGLAVEMGVIIYLGAQLGKWLDSTYTEGGRLFTISSTFLAIVIAFYVVLQQLKRINRQNSDL